jgi:large subunit ribosomal protein L24
MSTAKIQSGDKVKVTSGNHKGIVGIVTSVNKKIRANGSMVKRATVNTVPKIIKYRKSQTFQGQTYPGQKLEVDRSIDVSNLRLITSDDKLSKVKVELKDGKKTRVYKINGKLVEKTKIEKTSVVDTNEQTEIEEITTKVESTKSTSKKTTSKEKKEDK